MFKSKRYRLLTACIATFAVLLGVIAPTVTKSLSWLAHGRAQATHLAEQPATGHAAAHVPADEGGHEGHAGHEGGRGTQDHDAGQGHEGGGHGTAGTGHCPFCGTHAGSFGLPPAELPSFATPAAAHLLPHLYHHAPRPLFAWAAAHPRAPPAHA